MRRIRKFFRNVVTKPIVKRPVIKAVVEQIAKKRASGETDDGANLSDLSDKFASKQTSLLSEMDAAQQKLLENPDDMEAQMEYNKLLRQWDAIMKMIERQEKMADKQTDSTQKKGDAVLQQ